MTRVDGRAKMAHLNKYTPAPNLRTTEKKPDFQIRDGLDLSHSKFEGEFTPSTNPFTGKRLVLAGLGLMTAVGGVWGIANTHHVGPNEHAVLYNKATGEVQNSDQHGWFIPGEYNPFTTDIYTVTAEPQSFKLEDAPIRTKDKASTVLDAMVNYRVTDASAVVQQYGSIERLNDKVYSVARSVARSQAGRFSLDDLQIDAESRALFEEQMGQEIQERMERFARENFGDSATNPVTISTPELRDVVTPRAIAAERDATLVAVQKQRTAEANLEAKRLEAQGAVIEANAQKEAARVRAESEKEAAVLAAQGKREAADIEAEAVRTLDEAYKDVSGNTMRRLELKTLEEIDGQIVIGVDGIRVVTPQP